MELENRSFYDVENSLAEQKLEKLRKLRELQAELSKLNSGAAAYYNDPVGFARDCIHWGDRELTSYQAMVLNLLRDNRRVAIRAPRGTGKALALDTPLPTPTGWTTMGEVQVGDDLLDETGHICKVTGKSPVWFGDTYEVEFADKTVITTHGNHEWDAIDIHNRPKGVRDWRENWSATRRITTSQMCRTLRTPARGDARWHIPTAEPLRLPEADLPIDPYLFGYWLGDGSSGTNRITVNIKDWPSLEHQIRRAGYFHRISVKPGTENLTVTVSHSPVGEGRCKNGNVSMRTVLRDIGVLGNKSIPMMYKRASIEQRRELIRGLWDSDGFRGHGDDEITLMNNILFDDVVEVLHSLGLVVRTNERDARLNGRVVGRQWRAAVRFDFNPYRLDRYEWKPRGAQSSRHTQRTVVDVRRVGDQYTQCIEVDSPSHLFLAGHSMVPTHNSATSAITVLWFAITREASCVDWKIVTTAGSWNQLTNYLWPEIKKWSGKLKWDLVRDGKPFGQLELQNLSLRLRYGSAFAAASSNPALIEGAHADSLLVLFDESKAIPAETFDAIEGAFTGTGEIFTMAVSTPGPPQGRFYDIHTDRVKFRDWTARHITLEETLAAGQISKEWVEQRRVQWGEQSALYQNHVLGEFYAGEEDSVIPLSWVEAAVERWREWDANGREDPGKPHTVGVDIARSGTDKTVLALRQGNVITELRSFTINDTMATTGRVKSVLDNDENCTAIVDVIGIGAGVVDRLREQGARVQAFNAATRSNKRDKTNEIGFLNTRAAAWWNLRELLDPSAGSDVCLPPHDDMLGDLTAPRMGELMSGGKMKLESKDDLRKRIGRSTDFGDAVVQAFWTPSGNWGEAYGTVQCVSCGRGFLSVVNGIKRSSCPFCRSVIVDEDVREEGLDDVSPGA